MFIDYIPLLLVNMIAGLVLLAAFFWKGLGGVNERAWAPGFAAVGLVATAVGLHMTLAWPIPKLPEMNLMFANVAFGEMSVLFGAAFLAAAVALAMNVGLLAVTAYGAVAGAAAILVGIRIGTLHLTATPVLTPIGFILTAAGGMLGLAVVLAPKVRAVRAASALLLLAGAGIWVYITILAYWGHLERFSK